MSVIRLRAHSSLRAQRRDCGNYESCTPHFRRRNHVITGTEKMLVSAGLFKPYMLTCNPWSSPCVQWKQPPQSLRRSDRCTEDWQTCSRSGDNHLHPRLAPHRVASMHPLMMSRLSISRKCCTGQPSGITRPRQWRHSSHDRYTRRCRSSRHAARRVDTACVHSW